MKSLFSAVGVYPEGEAAEGEEATWNTQNGEAVEGESAMWETQEDQGV